MKRREFFGRLAGLAAAAAVAPAVALEALKPKPKPKTATEILYPLNGPHFDWWVLDDPTANIYRDRPLRYDGLVPHFDRVRSTGSEVDRLLDPLNFIDP